MIPWAHPIPQRKQYLDLFCSRFCTDDRRVSLYTLQWTPLLPSLKLPLTMGDLDPI